ncbi:tripartite tricarboxylate transporter TctB family protein [Natronococcus wangiae]|uniref:tripartite tricarboxylate transporter TctB family protein n=1 Tax=Natronococcus wangiae TaxID=3068275 RepID=UPI00273E1225|nr:tripartite tricarboxylate transporter TctB family protein [Natronococcus sp. AD5]
MTRITPPVVTVSTGSRTVDVDTGELVFPGIVLAFCLYYYWDTRALPDLSMLYAGPLLYATAALAVVTVLVQAVSIDERADGPEPESERSSDGPPSELASEEATSETPPDEPFFTARNAVLLVGLTAAYVATLEPIGFLVATIGFLAVVLYLFGERNPGVIALYSVGVAIAVWLVFVQWLMVPL